MLYLVLFFFLFLIICIINKEKSQCTICLFVLLFSCSIFMVQGEIGRRSGGDNVLEREGYAVSAGFSLGLVALGMINCYY